MGNKQAAVDPKELAKEQKRIINRSQRKLERESQKLERQEKKSLQEIKKLAEKGQHNAAKIIAKDVARTRVTRNQYLNMSSQLKSMSMQMQSMQMQQNIMTSLKGATGVMGKINEDMNVNEIRDVMKDFNKEMMKQEVIGEQVADGFSMLEDPNANADAEDLYNGILGEVGLEYTVG